MGTGRPHHLRHTCSCSTCTKQPCCLPAHLALALTIGTHRLETSILRGPSEITVITQCLQLEAEAQRGQYAAQSHTARPSRPGVSTQVPASGSVTRSPLFHKATHSS